MNCPFHILIFRSRLRSYRELPLRLFEFGTVYRYEKSGVVHGLTRVRGMTQDDAHIFTTKENMAEELTSLLDFVLGLLADYGLDDFYLELSTKPPGKAVGTRRGVGRGHRGAAPGRVHQGPRARARRGRRRLLRPEDLGAGARRHRAHVADVHHPARLPDAAALRHRVRRRRQRAAPADHDPPRPVRLDRAVLRRARRALRRGVPGLAGARAGAGAPGAQRPPRLRRPRRRPAAGRRLPGRRSARPRSRSARGSARPSSRSSRTSSSSATTTSRPARSASTPAAATSPSGTSTSTPSPSASPPRSRQAMTSATSVQAEHVAHARPEAVTDVGSSVPLEHLWATWRSAYVGQVVDSRTLPTPEEADGRSLFERILAGADEEGDEAAGVLWRGEHCFALLNLYPYTAGHLMVLPAAGGVRARGPHRRRARRAVDGGARRGGRAQGGVLLRRRERRA